MDRKWQVVGAFYVCDEAITFRSCWAHHLSCFWASLSPSNVVAILISAPLCRIGTSPSQLSMSSGLPTQPAVPRKKREKLFLRVNFPRLTNGLTVRLRLFRTT